MGDEAATDGEVEDGLAQLLDVFGAGSEARKMSEVEARGLRQRGSYFVASLGFVCGGRGCADAVQAGRHQPVALCLAFVLRRLQLVAKRHQFIDPTLNGWGNDWHWYFCDFAYRQRHVCCAVHF